MYIGSMRQTANQTARKAFMIFALITVITGHAGKVNICQIDEVTITQTEDIS